MYVCMDEIHTLPWQLVVMGFELRLRKNLEWKHW